MISCVAVIGAENNPVYIKSFDKDDDLQFHYTVHMSLDIIEEKLTRSGSSANNDMYLGFLGPIEDYKVYGYVTNTKVKFVIVVQEVPIKEADVKAFFTALHSLYVDTMSNPFAIIGERIMSKRFDQKLCNCVIYHNRVMDTQK